MKQGWKIMAIGNIAKVYNGNSINAEEKKARYEGLEIGYPFIATKDVGVNGNVDYDNGVKIPFDTDFKVALPDSVFVCAEGGSAGKKVAHIDRKVCFGNKLFALQPIKEKVLGSFLFYAVQETGFKTQFRLLMAGIIGGVSAKKFNSITIHVPPLSEQHRIVSLLDAEFAKIDALKANAEKNLQNAKDLFQAALKKELEPKEGWKKDFLSKIAYISRGRSQHRPRNEASLYGGDYPFIQTGDIRDANGGTISTFNQTYSEIGLQQSKLWKKGTICITIAANIGETAILGMDACFPDSVVGIIPDNQIVCTDFLNYCLTKEKDELNEIAHGTAQKNINVAILEKVLITYPIEISIQQSIVSRLDTLSEKCKALQANYEKTLSLCDDLKQALLTKAFNGEL